MGSFMPLYAFSLFLPTILAGMGYEGTRAQLLVSLERRKKLLDFAC